MNSSNCCVGVLAARVCVEHLVEVGHHVLDAAASPAGSAFSQRLLHAAELAVEHLAAQQVLDLLEGLRAPRASASRSPPARAPRAPCRAAARRARPRGAARRRTGRGTARRAPGPSAWSSSSRTCSSVPSSRPARRACRALLAHPPQHVVEAAPARRVPRRSRSRSASRVPSPSSTASPSSSSGRAHVVRRRERVRPAVPRAVAVRSGAASARPP